MGGGNSREFAPFSAAPDVEIGPEQGLQDDWSDGRRTAAEVQENAEQTARMGDEAGPSDGAVEMGYSAMMRRGKKGWPSSQEREKLRNCFARTTTAPPE